MPKEDLIEAHLALAYVYLCMNKVAEMDQELEAVADLFYNNPSTIHKHLFAFAILIKNVKKTATTSHYCKTNFADWISLARDNINMLDAKNQIEAKLNLDSLYQEELVDPSIVTINWEQKTMQLFGEIGSLQETSEAEINAKIDLFIRLSSFYNESHTKALILTQLIKLYDKCPAKSLELWDQTRLGERIFALSNEMGIADKLKLFPQQHIVNILKNDREGLKIADLVLYGSNVAFSKEHKKVVLEAAHALLSQAKSNSEQDFDLAQIANGYLQVNREISLAILASLQDRQAKNSKVIGIATAIATASIYFYPTVAPMLFLGAGVLRLYPSLISAVY
jgi:hypothetical protein